MSSRPPKVWKERFQLKRKLADTLQGHIYLAYDLQNKHEKVVVKETYKGLVDAGKSRDGHIVHEDFHNEIRLLTYLSKQPDADEGFVRIIHQWETDDCFYYAMQWCEAELFKFISKSFAAGGTMFQYMKRETNKQQIPCSRNNAHEWLANIQNIFRQCVKCMYWMQLKGVCHLDLSLENTMIFKVDGLKVKIIDFGLAKHYDYKNNEKDALFRNDKRVGKRGYMAPEVYNKMIYDARRADVWSLGVMLFMMLVGAPPYKRATQKDPAFNYIINGMLEDVLKHWKRLRLISKDALDCMKRIFRWEKERITMEQLIAHPFVGLENLLKPDSDPRDSYKRIIAVMKEYHDNYVLPMQAQYNKDGDDSKSDPASNEPSLITIKTDNLGQSDRLVLPTFVTACEQILSTGNVQLVDDFNRILAYHSELQTQTPQMLSDTPIKDTEDKPVIDDTKEENEERQSLTQLVDGLLNEIKNKQFVQIDNSIIIRRCFRNRLKCEDEKALLDVYGKYNKTVINDEQHRMAMQTMDRIYFYFAYTYNFGFSFNDDEVKQLQAQDDETNASDDEETNATLFKVKQMLKRKKQELLKSKHGKQIYNVIRDRKRKYCTASTYHFNDDNEEQKAEKRSEKAIPGTSIEIFVNIKDKMRTYLASLKSAPQQMSHKEFIQFLKQLQYRTKREDKLAALKSIPSEQWKKLIDQFNAAQMSEAYFRNTQKRAFGNMLKKFMNTGHIVKLYKVLCEELDLIGKKRFFTVKEEVELLDEEEIVQLLLTVLKETVKIDIENDLDLDRVRSKFAAEKMNGAQFMRLDEEYVIRHYIASCLTGKFGCDLDAHRFGKRFRYWPAYSENKTCDLLNGFYTHHWYVRPKFNDIKDEILNNEICCITVNQWNRSVIYASKVMIRTVAIKELKAVVPPNSKDGGSTSNSSYNKYGVKNGDRIRLEHLVPLLIYVNLDFVSKHMLQTYNNNNFVANEYQQWIKRMKHHSQLSHLARLVRETVECYGQSKAVTLYHLVDKKIALASLNARFFSPTSVTTSLNAALVLNDFNCDEVVVQLDCYRNGSSLKYFNCSMLSDYPNEHENILCGGLGCVAVTNIYDLCLSSNYEYHVQAMAMLMNAVNGRAIPTADKETIQKVGVALNALMQKRFKKKDAKEATYVHQMFEEMCNATAYAELNVKLILSSELMKFVLCNKNGSMRLDVLSNIFTNIKRYRIDLSGVDQDTQNNLIFNDKLIQFLAKKQVLRVKFMNVESTDSIAAYSDKFAAVGWKLDSSTFNNATTVTIDLV
eukprot:401363_1